MSAAGALISSRPLFVCCDLVHFLKIKFGRKVVGDVKNNNESVNHEASECDVDFDTYFPCPCNDTFMLLI